MTAPATVSVVMRTRDRVTLLKRAIESVLGQSDPDWQLVIVNDGGDPAPVEDLVGAFAEQAAGRILIVHNPSSLGMHGASAVGLRQAAGDLLTVHDDDDTWAPEFLTVARTTLAHVQASYGTVRGVTTYCSRVFERLQANLIHVDEVVPFNGWVPPGLLSLDRMLAGNFIPPISFVFEASAFRALQSRYELVPYLGDWGFLVRFLSQFDVYMIPRYLAFWHWRPDQSGTLGNSVVAEDAQHRFQRQLLLNQWLREDLAAGRFGIGCYANLRAHLETLLAKAG